MKPTAQKKLTVDWLAEKANFVTMHVVSKIVINFILLSISDMTEFL